LRLRPEMIPERDRRPSSARQKHHLFQYLRHNPKMAYPLEPDATRAL
jgi:hypothetical protein